MPNSHKHINSDNRPAAGPAVKETPDHPDPDKDFLDEAKYTVGAFDLVVNRKGSQMKHLVRIIASALFVANIFVQSVFAGDGCTYKQPPMFKDQDIHMSDGVCQRCEDGVWVDRYCSVCQQTQGANAGTSASAKTNKQSTRTKTSSAGANACTDGSDSYSNGARKGGPGNRQVCGNGTWTVTEPDTHTVCNAQ